MKKLYAVLFIHLIIGTAQSQSQVKTNFIVRPFTPAFVENKGQYNQYTGDHFSKAAPAFGSQLGNKIVLFHESGLQFVQLVCKRDEEEEKEREERHEMTERHREAHFEIYRQGISFLGASKNATIAASVPLKAYFTFPDPASQNQTIRAEAWEQLTVKDLYPGIDVNYIFKEQGIKYSFTVHPGADASQIRMQWSGTESVSTDAVGNLQIPSSNDTYSDAAPVAFYSGNEKQLIDCHFSVEHNVVSFLTGNYDKQSAIVIDPWITNPSFGLYNKGYDIQQDAAGDIYVYGGSNPYQLQKFTSTGSWIWTYNTSANGYYGDFTLDANGNVYCIYGPWGDVVLKINPAGILQWQVGMAGNSREIYRIFPNPSTGDMNVVGMELGAGTQNPMLLSIDTSNGAATTPMFHPTCFNGETRSLSVDANGDIYSMVFSGAMAGGISAPDNIIWKTDANHVSILSAVDGYVLGESEPSNTDSWYSGYNGTAINTKSFYTYDGNTVKKWNKAALTLLDSAVIAGGLHYVTAGLYADSCEHVFVGGPGSIIEFDSSLTMVTSVATPGEVYDVMKGNQPDEILATGDGFIGSFSFPATMCAGPPIVIFTAPHHVCPGTCTDFTNLSVNATSYVWSFPGGIPSSSVDVHPTGICYNMPGNYPVTLIASNQAGSDTLSLPNYITVYPFSPPQSIQQEGDTLISNTGFVTYQWYFNSSLIPGATEYFYIAPQSGNYSVLCTDDNDCEVEAVIFNVVASVNLPAGTAPLEIFPNPAGDEIEVRNFTMGPNSGRIILYNTLGERVIDLPALPHSSYLKIGIQDLVPGVYYIAVSDGSHVSGTRFLKQ